MEDKAIQYPRGVQRLDMPCRLDRSVHIEMTNYICDLFSREILPHAHGRETKEDTHLFYIWRTLPSDMTTLLNHFFVP